MRGSFRSLSAISDNGRPSWLGKRIGFGGQLLEYVDRGGVEERVHGVQAQAVGVEVPHPAQRAIDDVAAHLI